MANNTMSAAVSSFLKKPGEDQMKNQNDSDYLMVTIRLHFCTKPAIAIKISKGN